MYPYNNQSMLRKVHSLNYNKEDFRIHGVSFSSSNLLADRRILARLLGSRR